MQSEFIYGAYSVAAGRLQAPTRYRFTGIAIHLISSHRYTHLPASEPVLVAAGRLAVPTQCCFTGIAIDLICSHRDAHLPAGHPD